MAIDAKLENELRAMARSGGDPIVFTTDQRLFRVDEITSGLFLVERGLIRLERVTPSGDLITVHRAGAGTLVGEASIYSDRYHCDAVAQSAGVALHLTSDAMLARLSDDSIFAGLFNAYMARELMNLRQRIELLCIRSADARVRTHLATLVNATGRIPAGFVIRQLAEEIGFAPETYSRALRQLINAQRVRRNADGSMDLIPDAPQ